MWGHGPRMGIKFHLSMSMYYYLYRYSPCESNTNDNKHLLGYKKHIYGCLCETELFIFALKHLPKTQFSIDIAMNDYTSYNDI